MFGVYSRARGPLRGLGQDSVDPLAATCYSEALRQTLVAQCAGKGPLCSPETLTRVLSLPYCPGTCSAGATTTPLPASADTVPMGALLTAFLFGALATVAVQYAVESKKRPSVRRVEYEERSSGRGSERSYGIQRT